MKLSHADAPGKVKLLASRLTIGASISNKRVSAVKTVRSVDIFVSRLHPHMSIYVQLLTAADRRLPATALYLPALSCHPQLPQSWKNVLQK